MERYYVINIPGFYGELIYVVVAASIIMVEFFLGKKMMRLRVRRRALAIFTILSIIVVCFSVFLSPVVVRKEGTVSIRYTMFFPLNAFAVLMINLWVLLAGWYVYFKHSMLGEKLGIHPLVQWRAIIISLLVGQIFRIILLTNLVHTVYHIYARKEGTIYYDNCSDNMFLEVAIVFILIICVLIVAVMKMYAEESAKLRLKYLKSRVMDKRGYRRRPHR